MQYSGNCSMLSCAGWLAQDQNLGLFERVAAACCSTSSAGQAGVPGSRPHCCRLLAWPCQPSTAASLGHKAGAAAAGGGGVGVGSNHKRRAHEVRFKVHCFGVVRVRGGAGMVSHCQALSRSEGAT